ncbi:Ca(2+)-dependent cysteine protease [Nowakowskiella sp. JEL0407]|nr:Ca(2+)-dependent cysteine protease [Nowakowskiella sp. JEL0407]
MNFGNLMGAVTGGGGANGLMDMVVDKIADKLSGGEGGSESQSSDPSKMAGFQHAPPAITGKRRGLFIGINYFGTKAELGGCINDVHRVLKWVQSVAPFQDVLILTDDSQDPTKKPTRQNILNGLQWLGQGAQPGDSLFLHYSGHGATVSDTDGEEVDGLDSTIVPVDYESAGQITDDELHRVICQPLPAGCRLTTIMDCCHSGSILDLPYSYLPDGNLDIVMVDNRKAAIKMGLQAGVQFARGDKTAAFKAAKEAFGMYIKPAGHVNSSAQQKMEKEKTTKAFVTSFSGCMDEQTSADATIDGARSGALSWALLETLGKNPNQPYAQILKEVRGLLKGKYSQIPQLSTGFPVNLNSPFQI